MKEKITNEQEIIKPDYTGCTEIKEEASAQSPFLNVNIDKSMFRKEHRIQGMNMTVDATGFSNEKKDYIKRKMTKLINKDKDVNENSFLLINKFALKYDSKNKEVEKDVCHETENDVVQNGNFKGAFVGDPKENSPMLVYMKSTDIVDPMDKINYYPNIFSNLMDKNIDNESVYEMYRNVIEKNTKCNQSETDIEEFTNLVEERQKGITPDDLRNKSSYKNLKIHELFILDSIIDWGIDDDGAYKMDLILDTYPTLRLIDVDDNTLLNGFIDNLPVLINLSDPEVIEYVSGKMEEKNLARADYSESNFINSSKIDTSDIHLKNTDNETKETVSDILLKGRETCKLFGGSLEEDNNANSTYTDSTHIEHINSNDVKWNNNSVIMIDLGEHGGLTLEKLSEIPLFMLVGKECEYIKALERELWVCDRNVSKITKTIFTNFIKSNESYSHFIKGDIRAQNAFINILFGVMDIHADDLKIVKKCINYITEFIFEIQSYDTPKCNHTYRALVQVYLNIQEGYLENVSPNLVARLIDRTLESAMDIVNRDVIKDVLQMNSDYYFSRSKSEDLMGSNEEYNGIRYEIFEGYMDNNKWTDANVLYPTIKSAPILQHDLNRYYSRSEETAQTIDNL